MKRTATFVAALLVALTAAASAQWLQTAGPEGATLNSLVAQQDTIVAFTDAGIYANFAGRWAMTANSDRYIKNTRSAGGALYGLLNDRLVRSIDLGQSWIPVAPHRPGLSSDVVGNASVAYRVDSLQLYRSTDRGASWQHVTELVQSLTIIGLNDGVLLGARSNFGFPPVKLYRSTDMGTTWSHVNDGLPGDGRPAWLRVANGMLYGTFSGGLHQSSDGGVTWTQLPEFDAVLKRSIFRAIASDGSGSTLALVEPSVST